MAKTNKNIRFVKRFDDCGKVLVYLDYGDLKIPDIKKQDLDALLTFKITTYDAIKSQGEGSEVSWDMVFGPVHRFLDTCDENLKIKYVSMLAYLHFTVLNELSSQQELTAQALISVEKKLSHEIAKFNRETDLVTKILEFVQDQVPIYLFNNVGERPQDTLKMTFFRDDIVQLTAGAVLSKLLTPIFGVFMESCKWRMDSIYKEIHCAAMLKEILADSMSPLVEKFSFFVKNIVKKSLNRIKLSQVFNGFTESMITQQILSSLWTRKLPSVDIFKKEGNLVTYVTMCVRGATQTQFSGSNSKEAVTEITPVREQSSDEDGNLSSLEKETKTSNKPADFKLIIKAAVRSVERFVTEYDLDRELLNNTLAYYTINHISLTPANSYLMGIMFSGYLDGANSIDMLSTNNICYLTAVMQVFFKQYGYTELIELVSAKSTAQPKILGSGVDTSIKNTWNGSKEYKQCNDAFPFIINRLRWDTRLKDIVDTFSETIYFHNTAPALIDAMNCEMRNGAPYQMSENTPQAICSLILIQVLGHTA